MTILAKGSDTHRLSCDEAFAFCNEYNFSGRSTMIDAAGEDLCSAIHEPPLQR